jgi:DNA-directed RNA polymerase subunit RPC12/RpoP
MARAHTKCADCGDVLWFRDSDPEGQRVVCPCGSTNLTEDGSEGNFVALTAGEITTMESNPEW